MTMNRVVAIVTEENGLGIQGPQPSSNGVDDQDAAELTAAEVPNDQPVSTEELIDVQDLYVDADEDELSSIAVRLPKSIPIRRVSPSEWFTVHPDPAYSRVVVLLDQKTGNKETTYFVSGAALQKEMRKKYGAKNRRIYLAQNNDKHLFFLAVGLPAKDGSVNRWTQNGYVRIEAAKRGWIHSSADMEDQNYDLDFAVEGKIDPPQWPTESMDVLVQRAAKQHMIVEGDHPLLRRLREGA